MIFLLVVFTDNVHCSRCHKLGPHELHKVPVGQLRHGVGEGERPHGGHLPAVAGERHLAADRDQGHRQSRDYHQEQDQERPHVHLPLACGELREVGAEEIEVSVGVGGARRLTRDLGGGGVVTPAA